MEHSIPEETIISSIQAGNHKLIIVGALIDLAMKNGWVKKDEFVPIDFNDAVSAMKQVNKFGFADLGFTSKLIDANNAVRNVRIQGQAQCHRSDRTDIKIPSITNLSAEVYGDGLACSNVRLVTHLSVGCQVLGVDYANGDFLRMNVPHQEDAGQYRW